MIFIDLLGCWESTAAADSPRQRQRLMIFTAVVTVAYAFVCILAGKYLILSFFDGNNELVDHHLSVMIRLRGIMFRPRSFLLFGNSPAPALHMQIKRSEQVIRPRAERERNQHLAHFIEPISLVPAQGGIEFFLCINFPSPPPSFSHGIG